MSDAHLRDPAQVPDVALATANLMMRWSKARPYEFGLTEVLAGLIRARVSELEAAGEL